MTRPPLFSCIVTTHSRPDLVCRAIKSILNQKNVNDDDFEIIVVRDGGWKGNFTKAKNLLRPHDSFIECKKNVGQSATRNLGVRHSKGLYLSFLDDDDWWVPHFLRTMHKELIDYPSTDMVYGKLVEEHTVGGIRFAQPQFHGHFDAQKLLMGNYISPIAVMIKRSSFNIWGGFDEELFQNGCWGAEDWLLWIKATFFHSALLKQIHAVMAVNFSRAENKASLSGEMGGYRKSAEWFQKKYNFEIPYTAFL